MAKAVGIGGVFLKVRDPKKLKAWYVENLGIPMSEHGIIAFEGPEAAGTTAFEFFAEDAKYFGDGDQRAMINFRVDSLGDVLERLTNAGVRIDPKREDAPWGRFAWIWDPEGNRIELWEPAPE